MLAPSKNPLFGGDVDIPKNIVLLFTEGFYVSLRENVGHRFTSMLTRWGPSSNMMTHHYQWWF
jgi:hypothetical protein